MGISRGVSALAVSACVFAIGCSGGYPTSAEAGSQGPAGVTGAPGPTGATGDTGAQGPSGATGPEGPSGAAGAAGLEGPSGAAGAAGPEGPSGAAGADGATGPKGDPGGTADGSPSLLLEVTTVAAGDVVCPAGGLKIEHGADDDHDGTLDPGEVDKTSYACLPTARKRVMFVTSQTFDGNLGGVAGGNAKCQAAANAVPSLAGKTFAAWLSDEISQPASMPKTDGYFVSTTGETIAESYADLRDTALLAKMSTENGAPFATPVWTGSDENGERLAERCQNWSSADAAVTGIQGNSDVITWYWSYWAPATCDSLGSLYCVEQ